MPIVRPHPGRYTLDASSYLRSVLEAVKAGNVTARQYADLHGLSINTASAHYQHARRVGLIQHWGRYADGIHYRLVEREVPDV